MKTAIIVHGGAHEIPPGEEESRRRGCLAAVRAGWQELQAGRSAVDAVEAAIRVLEDDPSFNAGHGSSLNADGDVEMDAGLMEGTGRRCGAVAALRGVRNPITAARKVWDTGNTILLAGEGARRFAEEHGVALCESADLITPHQRRNWEEEVLKKGDGVSKAKDTVGCVALDLHGSLVCGTSTGGLTNKLPGRVGDSPLVGCGLYADETGAAALTGDGEQIIRLTLARTAVNYLRDNLHPDAAAKLTIGHFKDRMDGEAGCIIVDPSGRVGWAHNSPHMPCAYLTWEMENPVVVIQKSRSPHVHS